MINKNDIVFKTNNNTEQDSIATYGWVGHDSFGFKKYYLGYKKAVVILYEKYLLSSKEEKEDIIDLIIYPLCFLIRHCSELFLKYIFVSYSMKNEKEKSKFYSKSKHNVYNTWKTTIRKIVEDLLNTQPNNIDLDILDSYFKQIQDFDSSSMKMRYPCNINNSATNHNNESLDVKNSVPKILEFFDYLETIDSIIDGTTYLFYFKTETEKITEIDKKIKNCENTLIQLKILANKNIQENEDTPENKNSLHILVNFSDIAYDRKPFWEKPIGKILMGLDEEELKTIISFLYSARDLLYNKCKLVSKNKRNDFIKIMIGYMDECNIHEEICYKTLAEEHVKKISGWKWKFLFNVLKIGLDTCGIITNEEIERN